MRGTAKKRFDFSTIAQLATIGRRTGVANILGINFSGFIAWWLWRTIYLFKLPRFEKKLRVALDWTLDLIFSKDLVQFLDIRASAVSRPEAHPSPKSKTLQPELSEPVPLGTDFGHLDDSLRVFDRARVNSTKGEAFGSSPDSARFRRHVNQ